MQKRVPRREFVHHLGMITAVTSLSSIPGYASMDTPVKSPFRVAVINDEISQDFGRACEVASREFGMECRTGNHAKKFVTNRFGQTHDVARLYVCDSSVFLNCTEKTT